ncbi:MAG: hypothetical protein U0805_13580 [Pirellulales bacterium]
MPRVLWHDGRRDSAADDFGIDADVGGGADAAELVGVLGGLACIFMLVEEGMQRGMSPGLLGLTMIIPLSSALSNTVIMEGAARAGGRCR